MKRGIFAALAIVAATVVPPASAAAPKGVVYEVVRHPSAPDEARVRIADLGEGPMTIMYAELVPEGKGYRWWSAGAQYSSGGGGWTEMTVELPRGHRFIAGGVRGRTKVTVNEKGWSVREIGSGFRLVTAHATDVTYVAGVPVERRAKAVVPAGAYGSMAWSRMDCGGIGEWSVDTGAEGERQTYDCGPPSNRSSSLDSTLRGRRWTVEGQLYGVRKWQIDVAVMDLPKR